ncbi:MAG: hypothetical protein ACO1OB_26360 [Archangium sp.]
MDELDEAIPPGILTFHAVALGSHLSAKECEKQRGSALDLRRNFQSSPLWREVTNLRWLYKWPGMKGRGLGFTWRPSKLYVPKTLRDLFSPTLGRWEDVWACDAKGVVVFAISHEDMAATRPHDGWHYVVEEREGEPVDAAVRAFLRSES